MTKREGASRVAAGFAATGGPAAAAHAIDELLAGHSSSSRQNDLSTPTRLPSY
jgi:hypothetical protein